MLTWYLGNIFYPAIGDLVDPLAARFPAQVNANSELVSIGFWPGGDRDGNPFVTTATTLKVAAKLRYTILQCYHHDLRLIKRRLTFAGVYDMLDRLEKRIHDELVEKPERTQVSLAEIFDTLDRAEALVKERFQAMYIEQLQSFRRKVALFGMHFASIDIRQDSRVIAQALNVVLAQCPEALPADFDRLAVEQQLDCLLTCRPPTVNLAADDAVVRDTIESVLVMRQIQAVSGERGAHLEAPEAIRAAS